MWNSSVLKNVEHTRAHLSHTHISGYANHICDDGYLMENVKPYSPIRLLSLLPMGDHVYTICTKPLKVNPSKGESSAKILVHTTIILGRLLHTHIYITIYKYIYETETVSSAYSSELTYSP